MVVVNWSAGRGVGKLVGRVVAMAGKVGDKKKDSSRLEGVKVVTNCCEGRYYEDSRIICLLLYSVEVEGGLSKLGS